jgi:cytochrome P450
MPLFNWIFGHLLVIKEYRDKLPADAGFQCLALTISRAFPQQHMFYLDFWPFTIPLLVVANPYAADQIMKHTWIDKPKNVFEAFWQMSGGPNMITMPEKPWKRWRAIFNPAFGPGYIQELVPKLVDQGEIFCEKLRAHAKKGKMFELEEATFRLAIDVIGVVGM